MLSLFFRRNFCVRNFQIMAGRNHPVTESNYPVHHDLPNGKFYIQLDPENEAILEYAIENGIMDMYHTEVPPSYQGRGLAGLLAKAAFEHAVTDNRQMRLTCTYLQKYFHVNQKDEYKKLIVL